MRQALALLQWAHKFGPEKHVQRAERYLCERLRLMTTVRSPCCVTCMRRHGTSCASETVL